MDFEKKEYYKGPTHIFISIFILDACMKSP
jgi:hypothetical protein